MSIAGAPARAKERLRWSASLALAIGINTLAVAILVLNGRHRFAVPRSPSIELSLLPPFERPTDLDRAAPGRPPGSRARTDRATSPPRPHTPLIGPAWTPAAPAGPAAPPGVESGAPTPDLGRVFRASLGCSDPTGLRLSAEERDRCAMRLGQGAREVASIPAPIDPGKRAWFDATLAAYHSEGHPPGVVCMLHLSGGKATTGPPHSLRLGKLPCFILPPQGVLTEESAVAPPEHVEAR